MKKIILLLSFMPILVFAQTGNNKTSSAVPIKYHVPREGHLSPVVNHIPTQPASSGQNGKSHPQPAGVYVPSLSEVIGTTVYDLQTNAALAKRLQLYSGGKATYVWIKSDDSADANFTTRYSGYNTYSGTSWLTKKGNTSAYESARCGWPSIGQVTNGTSTYELLTSHYAQAASNIYAGGIFWYENTGIGQTNFSQVIDKSSNRALTSGLLWPRMATSNNRVYMIGTYEDDRKIKGVYNPIVYFCYNTSTGKFESKNITLPGYDSTRYGTGSADEYSIDARGQYVAIIAGGYTNDLALWKSSDSGKTFTKTIINKYAQAPWNPKIDATFSDTAVADDGTGSVALDNNGVAHVTYTAIKEVNLTQGDSSVNIYINPRDSIIYWNDKDQKKIYVGGCIDYDKTGAISYGSGQTDENFAGYGHDFACYSNISVDPSGNIFVVFSAPHEDDIDNNGNCFRHVYCSAFDAAHNTWHAQQDIVPTWQVENVYATVSRDADSKLHLVMMRDPYAGIFWPGTTNAYTTEGTSEMVYEEVSTTDILTDKVGLIDLLGVNENAKNNIFTTGSIFPNPANDRLNISINMARTATVTVKLYNMLGGEMLSQNYEMLPEGANNLQLGLSNLPQGMYFCNVTSSGFTTTERVVIER